MARQIGAGRRLAVAASVAAVLVWSLGIAAQEGGWRANPQTVREHTQRQPAFNYDEESVPPYVLPDVLKGSDGIVRTVDEWRARRTEILDLFRENVYGRSPGRPEGLRFAVLEEDANVMDGAATLKRVAVLGTQDGREHRFELTIFLPNARPEPVGVFLLLNNRPATNTDPTRRERSGFWPAEQVIARGYGIAALQVGDLAPDDPRRFRDGAIWLFEGVLAEARSPAAWGALAAWAWGASRAMDYFETDPGVDAGRVAVVGHSRGGKAALWAGAEDERFALVVSNDSGEGGAALTRRNFGETLSRITEAFPHWFAGNYKSFAGRASTLPVDQHMLLALVAPRGLYVASADEDLWADPRGEFLSLAHTSPVYALWGEPSISPDEMPSLDRPLVVGRRGYHVRTGTHNLTPFDWERVVDFGDANWQRAQ
ncbi:MAG: acetylxylan esterase [Vicinamibacterales bacterium]